MYQTPKILVYVAQSATHTSSFKHYFLQNKQPLPLPFFSLFFIIVIINLFPSKWKSSQKEKNVVNVKT
jgi:hypothetical protein